MSETLYPEQTIPSFCYFIWQRNYYGLKIAWPMGEQSGKNRLFHHQRIHAIAGDVNVVLLEIFQKFNMLFWLCCYHTTSDKSVVCFIILTN